MDINFPPRESVGETDLMYWDLVEPLNPTYDNVKEIIKPYNEKGEKTAEFLEAVKAVKKLGLVEAKELLVKMKNAKAFYSELEQNKKLDSNGLYGYVGASFAEYTSMRVAGDITAEGRNIFKIMDTETTKLLDNVLVNYKGGKKGLLDIFVDFKEAKERFGDIIRVNENPKKIPHLVESTQVCEYKSRGSRGNPHVEYVGKTTRHTVLYGDTDSVCIGFENICRSYGIIPESDDPKRVSRFVEWFCLKVLIPFYHKIIQNLCDKRNVTNTYILECEQILEKMHLYAKKCYCSSLAILDGKSVYEKGDVKAGGIVIKKTSYPKIIRKKLKDLENIMLRSVNKDKNNLDYITKLMSKHIDIFSNRPVEELCNTQTVRKFSEKTELVNGYYKTIKGAGVNEKGMVMYNNHVIANNLNIPLLGNGSKVKTYPLLSDGGEEEYFSWDIDSSESPPSWSPKPNFETLIYKKYTKNAILYVTTEYPHLIGREDYLRDPKTFPKLFMKVPD